MADTDKLKTDNSDLQTGKWGTGLLKSYLDERGDLFTKMSDTMCKELEKQLYSSEEVNLFKDELDNKKKLTSSIKISNKNTIIADKIDYLIDDLDSLFYNDRKEKEPIDKDKIMESVGLDEADNNTSKVSKEVDTFNSEPENNDIQMGQTAENIGGGWFDTFKSRFGDKFKENAGKYIKDFLNNGPGGANGWDLFRGMGTAFSETWNLNRDSVLRIGKLYNTDPKFKKWYDTIYDIATKGNKSDVVAGIQGIVNNAIVKKENTSVNSAKNKEEKTIKNITLQDVLDKIDSFGKDNVDNYIKNMSNGKNGTYKTVDNVAKTLNNSTILSDNEDNSDNGYGYFKWDNYNDLILELKTSPKLNQKDSKGNLTNDSKQKLYGLYMQKDIKSFISKLISYKERGFLSSIIKLINNVILSDEQNNQQTNEKQTTISNQPEKVSSNSNYNL